MQGQVLLNCISEAFISSACTYNPGNCRASCNPAYMQLVVAAHRRRGPTLKAGLAKPKP